MPTTWDRKVVINQDSIMNDHSDSSEHDVRLVAHITTSSDGKKKQTKKPHKLSLEDTEDFNAKLKRRGVIYLSRVPPRMGPSKLKKLLSEFGSVTRVYLEEEDKAARKRRQRATGSKNGGKRYKEGWVEYEDKKVSRRVAQSLNNTPITNQKRNVHFGDLWNLKYLSKFQWAHLTEKVAFERRVREQKLRIEMVHARKENQAYSNLVEAGKVMDRIENRRKKRNAKDDADDGRRTRKFKQTKPVKDKSDRSAKKTVLGSLV
jgi:ESF2/ABP1 family protein|eukprot:scaffold4850_cov265-Chaetoceros_neogracile.AAC.9